MQEYTSPDFRRIQQATDTKMDLERKLEIMKASFEDYFSEDYVDEDSEE